MEVPEIRAQGPDAGKASYAGTVRPTRARRRSVVLPPRSGRRGTGRRGCVHDSWGRPYRGGSERRETGFSPQGPFSLKGSSWLWSPAGPLPLGWWC